MKDSFLPLFSLIPNPESLTNFLNDCALKISFGFGSRLKSYGSVNTTSACGFSNLCIEDNNSFALTNSIRLRASIKSNFIGLNGAFRKSATQNSRFPWFDSYILFRASIIKEKDKSMPIAKEYFLAIWRVQ